MKQLYLTIIMLLTAAITINAAPRSKRQITDAATQVLNSPTSGIRLAPRQERITELRSNDAVTVMGYPSGGYAIIANDDRMPAVLGYSDTKFDTTNPGFMWYLDAVSYSVRRLSQKEEAVKNITPDSIKYAASVGPFVKTKWGQLAPFNSMCPKLDSNGTLPPTGCVATAMAQILYYNEYPASGKGEKSVTFIVNGSDTTTLTVDFSKSRYDYSQMLTDYSGDYTKEQADAVAKLMLDCGVAAKMTYTSSASGANAGEALKGFRDNFLYAKSIGRFSNYNGVNETWLNRIFSEISNGRAVLMTGDGSRGGHAFVLDGYQKDGKVHINWGWNGGADGFYDLSQIDFSNEQEMIVGIKPQYDMDSMAVKVKVPGTLPQLLPLSKAHTIAKLKVSGDINSTDFKLLRLFARRDSLGGIYPHGRLEYLDLRDANIVSGGEPFLVEGDQSFTTHDNSLPERAFHQCGSLKTILLPNSLDSIGVGSITGISGLDSVYVPDGIRRNYCVSSGAIYSKDTAELVMALPNCPKDFKAPFHLRKIDDYAFEGSNINSLTLYPYLWEVGRYSLARLSSIKELRVSNLFSIKDNTFYDINGKCKIYVPRWGNEKYKDAWKFNQSSNEIKEWGLSVLLKNPGCHERAYGDSVRTDSVIIEYLYDPDGLMKISGTQISICDTTTMKSSTGQRYYYCITGYSPTYGFFPVGGDINNFFVVTPGEGYLKVNSFTHVIGERIPNFELSVAKLKNDETVARDLYYDGWHWKVTDAKGNDRTADWHENVGVYTVSYASSEVPDAKNYIFPLKNIESGTVTVVEKAADSISKTRLSDHNDNRKAPIYNLQGQMVSDSYKGLVIINGRKILRK